MTIRIHWALPVEIEKASAAEATRVGVPELDFMIEFCRAAEQAGIDSLLVPFGFHTPDPLTLVGALCGHTRKIRFMIAYRSGLQSPTLFAQQVNTLSLLSGGRVSLNMVAGISPEEQGYYGDFHDHDARYDRADEFLSVCRSLWRGEVTSFEGKHCKVTGAKLHTRFVGRPGGPEIYIGGNSPAAQRVAMKHGSCWLRYADTPDAIAKSVAELDGGIETGLRLSVIARDSEAEALAAARHVVSAKDSSWKDFIRSFVAKGDSVAVKSTFELAERAPSEWLTPTLWAGAVPYRGGPGMALVGTPEQVAAAIGEYAAAGIRQFIFSGWPNIDELEYFGRRIQPLLSAGSAGAGRMAAGAGASRPLTTLRDVQL